MEFKSQSLTPENAAEEAKILRESGSKTPEITAKLAGKLQQQGILKGPKSTFSDRGSVKSNQSVEFAGDKQVSQDKSNSKKEKEDQMQMKQQDVIIEETLKEVENEMDTEPKEVFDVDNKASKESNVKFNDIDVPEVTDKVQDQTTSKQKLEEPIDIDNEY